MAIAQRQAQAFSLAHGVQVTVLPICLSLNVFPSDCVRRWADKDVFTWIVGLRLPGEGYGLMRQSNAPNRCGNCVEYMLYRIPPKVTCCW